MKSKIYTKKEDGVAWITLNRPGVYNAMDEDMLRLLAGELADLNFDNEIRAVIITGEGKVFCSGGDLRSMHDFPRGPVKGVYELAGLFHRVVGEIRHMKIPVIAAINGIAAGGGLSLALACDFRIMVRSATLIQAYTSHGLSVDGGASFVLPRLVGLARAMEIVAFDRPIPAEKALSWGLITQVAEDDHVIAVAKDMASRFSKSSLFAFGVCKRLMLDSLHTGLEAQLKNERAGISSCVAHGDGEEGIRAFLEKREPVFK